MRQCVFGVACQGFSSEGGYRGGCKCLALEGRVE